VRPYVCVVYVRLQKQGGQAEATEQRPGATECGAGKGYDLELSMRGIDCGWQVWQVLMETVESGRRVSRSPWSCILPLPFALCSLRLRSALCYLPLSAIVSAKR
jgi:hypothetical protein